MNSNDDWLLNHNLKSFKYILRQRISPYFSPTLVQNWTVWFCQMSKRDPKGKFMNLAEGVSEGRW